MSTYVAGESGGASIRSSDTLDHAMKPDNGAALCGTKAHATGRTFHPRSPFACKRCAKIATGEAHHHE